MRDFLIVCLYGILEGVTEWLPISSTGHIILLESVLPLPLRPATAALFEVTVQLGAILAVAVLFFGELFPFRHKKPDRTVLRLWGRVLLALLPCVLIGALAEKLLAKYLFSPLVVAITLILYGLLFLLAERIFLPPVTRSIAKLTRRQAIFVGLAQALSMIPGTSRSGATMLGGRFVGLSLPTAAKFSFFLGIPTMLGASLLKTVSFLRAGERLLPREGLLLLSGAIVAFLISLVTVRFLLDFVRRHGLAPFGVYRLLLGGCVLLYLCLH